jgi:hypothetical protein
MLVRYHPRLPSGLVQIHMHRCVNTEEFSFLPHPAILHVLVTSFAPPCKVTQVLREECIQSVPEVRCSHTNAACPLKLLLDLQAALGSHLRQLWAGS